MRKRSPKLHLTERALKDITQIDAYSVQTFGRKTANRHPGKIENGLEWIKQNPELMRSEPEIHESLKFYRVEKHLLVCESSDTSNIIVLAVINATMDIPSRLLELEPTLAAELAILRGQLRRE